MPAIQRTSDLIELIAEKSLTFAFGGICGLGFAGFLLHYRGEGMFVPLAIVIILISLPVTAYATYSGFQIRKVKAYSVICPYCDLDNQLVEEANDDINCRGCNRMIPIQDGKILTVSQVRCGFCNALNYYSDKTEVLLCEECNHEIPIAVEEGRQTKSMPSFYAVKEDDALYELVLIAHGAKTDELISTLQHMLALNRGQVKQLLGELPVTLLTGITRRKAEMLTAQLSICDGAAEFRPLAETTHA
jgi:uncharacterized protein YbaR (Trm112 family)